MQKTMTSFKHLSSLICESCQLDIFANLFVLVLINKFCFFFSLVHFAFLGISPIAIPSGFKYLDLDNENLSYEIKTQFGRSIHVLCGDNTSEHLSSQFLQFMVSNCILHQSFILNKM